jgi:hypothetical protein
MRVPGLVGLASRVWKTVGSWRKRASPPRKPVERIVGRWAPGAFRSLARALDQARPGDLIRIVDDEIYDGQVWIDDPERWRGLTVEAAPGSSPTLMASNGSSVVTIRDVPEVRIGHLTIRPRPDQSAVRIEGRAEGVTLQSLQSEKAAESPEPHVWIGPGSQGSSARPICIRACRFSGGSAGVVVQGAPCRPVRCLRVEENGFRDLDVHLALRAHLRDVSVTGNRFSGGTVGILVDVPPLRAERLAIRRNSLIGVLRWIDPGGSDPEQAGVVIAHNAVFEPPADGLEDERRLVLMARRGWHLEANLRESSRPADPAEGLLYRSVEHLEVVSRDPDSPRFLHPAPGSLLSGDGPGAHVGALYD